MRMGFDRCPDCGELVDRRPHNWRAHRAACIRLNSTQLRVRRALAGKGQLELQAALEAQVEERPT